MCSTCLIFLGPPGCGKGTQAQRLNHRCGLVQLSSGNVLRHEIYEGSSIGQKANEYIKQGDLVPDDVITGIMLAAIDKLSAGTGFILDGYPRTLSQAEALTDGLVQRNIPLHGVIDFEIPDEVVVARIAGRRVCQSCGATYNVEFLPPQVEGVCDECGRPDVIQRRDDRPEVVEHRLETYRDLTEPLIAYYRERDMLVAVDGTGSADEVEQRILDSMGLLNPRCEQVCRISSSKRPLKSN